VTALHVSACEYVTALTYTKNYGCGGSILAHLWSLSVEEQFYLLWPPILALAPSRYRRWIVLALLTLGPLSRALEYRMHEPHYFWLTSNMDVLMVGCAAALWRPAVPRQWFDGSVAPWLRTGALVLLLIPELLRAHLLLGWYTVMFGPLTQALATAYLICSLVGPGHGIMFKALNSRPVAFFGKASYSVYVWQQLFAFPPALYGFHSAILLTLPWNMVGAVGLGLSSYLLLERPLAGLRARLHRGRQRELRLASIST
jgi:peptidoglycan/LPS O-acetylase OafA/YrhL